MPVTIIDVETNVKHVVVAEPGETIRSLATRVGIVDDYAQYEFFRKDTSHTTEEIELFTAMLEEVISDGGHIVIGRLDEENDEITHVKYTIKKQRV